jgi:hypothetical protein
MAMRIAPDEGAPSVAIEIPLEKPLPDYDMEQVEQPTPRDIDALLVSQGFRDLVDDARGVLTDLVAHPPEHADPMHLMHVGFSDKPNFEIAQLTGAICPADDGVYRPGLWIVLKDLRSPQKHALSETTLQYAREIARQLIKTLGLC